MGIISVDTANHVICGAMADFADTKDSNTTEKIVSQTIDNLQENDLQIEEVLADTGYSSGVSYDYLDKQDITAYIAASVFPLLKCFYAFALGRRKKESEISQKSD